jgi:hypothetical protein
LSQRETSGWGMSPWPSDVVEAMEHTRVRAEAVYAERNHDGLAALSSSPLDEGSDVAFGDRTLVGPVFA